MSTFDKAFGGASGGILSTAHHARAGELVLAVKWGVSPLDGGFALETASFCRMATDLL